MREILFRGKQTYNGEWVYGIFCPDVLEMEHYGKMIGGKPLKINGFIRRFNPNAERGKRMEMLEVERDTVGQYTGLTDKNGTKIFEGDILHFINTYRKTNNEWLCTVEFLHSDFVCRYVEKDGHTGEYNHFGSWNAPLVQWAVIGNIHDTPELLEDEILL